MVQFAVGISYGLASASVFWALGLIARSIYRAFHQI